MSIPFITQQGNGVYNDCGPACVAMLSKWLGRVPVVADIAEQIDTKSDGTTGWDVGRGLQLQGLTPTYVNGALPLTRPYPFIQLVSYPALPRKAPNYETYSQLHWIVRIDDTTYHDPLFPNSDGANIVSTKAILDAAYRTVTSGPSIIGIAERPANIDNAAFDGEVMVEWTVRDDPAGAKIGVFPSGAKFHALGTLTHTDGSKWAVVQRGAGGAPVDLWDGTKRTGPVLDYVAYGAGWRKVGAPPIPTPPPAAKPTPSRLLGVHALGDDRTADNAIANGAKAITLMSGLHSYQLAQGHRDVAVLYRWYTNAPLSADDWCRGAGFDPNGGVNNGDYRYILGINEYDVPGFGGAPTEIRSRAAFDKRRVEILRRVAPNAKICIGGFPHGNPDFTNPAVVQAMKDYYAPIYNNQNPDDPDVYFCLHNYTKTIKSEGGNGPKADPTNWYGADWFELRSNFLFTHCGFNPSIRAVLSDETGGELGAGSFRWAGYSPTQFAFWCSYYLNLMAKTLVVGNKEYPQPFVMSTMFQGADEISGQSGHWGGYWITPEFSNVLGAYYAGTRRAVLRMGVMELAHQAPPANYVPERKVLQLA